MMPPKNKLTVPPKVMLVQNLLGFVSVSIAFCFLVFFWLPHLLWVSVAVDIYKFLPNECARSLTKWAVAKQYPLIFINPIDDIHAHSAGSNWGHGVEFSFQVSSTNGPLKLKRAELYHLVPLIPKSGDVSDT